MPRAIANVQTTKPSPYLTQLCKHFSHQAGDDFSVQFDDLRGEMRYRSTRFGQQTILLDASADDLLVLTAVAETTDGLTDVERWVGSHLERFGRRDQLEVKWLDS